MTNRLRVKLQWTGASWTVDLPDYMLVTGSCLPIIPDVIGPDGPLADAETVYRSCDVVTVQVDVPDRICDPETGDISIPRIQALYRGQPRWDTPGKSPDI